MHSSEKDLVEIGILWKKIQEVRRVSDDKESIEYRIDRREFYDSPALTALAIARVLFYEDVIKWFRKSGDKLYFETSLVVYIIFSIAEFKRSNKIFSKVMHELKKHYIQNNFFEVIEKKAKDRIDLEQYPIQSYMVNWIEFDYRMYKKDFLSSLTMHTESKIKCVFA